MSLVPAAPLPVESTAASRPDTLVVTGSAEPADSIALAVLACPGVAALSGGLVGEVATYLPGRRVMGVRVRDTGVTVAVVARWTTTVPALVGQVRLAVSTARPGLPVDVSVDDIELPPVVTSD